MRISTRGDYACRALLSLALHADEQGPTSVRDIADRTALPQPYLEQILLALKGAGLVKSKRGVGGGYILARDPADIRLSEIVSAVDGPITLGDFGQPHQDGACDHEGQCVLLGIWNQAGDHMRTYLEGFTLAGIAAIARGDAPGRSSSASRHVANDRVGLVRLVAGASPAGQTSAASSQAWRSGASGLVNVTRSPVPG